MNIPGANIRLLREQAGMNQRALAKAAGIDPANLSRLERGEGGYSRESIQAIADVLGVSIGVLFADPVTVEAAALRMRRVPVLTPNQLLAWKSQDGWDPPEDQEYLHGDLRRLSRFVFALRVQDLANAPRFEPGDELIFDANKTPEMGSVVVAQTASAAVFIGRFRPIAMKSGATPAFEVVPNDHLYPSASSAALHELKLRGTLVESRKLHS